MGETWRTKSTCDPCGAHTRSAASATPRPIDWRISFSKSAAISCGWAIRSTLPSRAVAMRRTSATCHADPTPRQSHWNRPRAPSIAALSCSGLSCWL